MAEKVGEAVLGVALPGAWKAGVYLYDVFSGSTRKKFQQNVKNLLPTIKKICDSSSESLEKFQEFHDNIDKGNRLVDERLRSHNFLWKFWVQKRVKKLQKYINQFIRNDLPSIMALIQIQAQDSLSTQLENVRGEVGTVRGEVQNISSKIEEHTHLLGQIIGISKQDESLCEPPDPPRCLLGFDEHIEKLKNLVLAEGVNVVGITAMGGAGKSTLAAAVCHHNEIKGHFEERIFYIPVSESPDLPSILQKMWKKIGLGGSEPDFTKCEYARNKLQSQINSIKKPTLVVLDDIWSKLHLEELLFEGEQYKTLVTTRNTMVIPGGPNTRFYELTMLKQEHALSLFCQCAFRIPTIPSNPDLDEVLVKQVQEECRGLPLALQVIGRSMYGRSDWERAKNMLSEGEPFDEYHTDGLFKRLKASIDVLDDDEKQCFLDLVAFPQRETVPANALLDIWVYVRGMKSDKAAMILVNFAARHLLDLKKNSLTPEITDDCMNGYFFSQHDVMRDLAMYLANQDNRNHFIRRVYMPQMQSDFPSNWQTDPSKAQIVSIHTGAMEETQWPEMEFPEAEALVLYFTATEYCIPTFLHTMKKLKVLLINNGSAKRAKLSGLDGLRALSQLQTLRLERLIVPPLYEYCNFLKNLQKLYLSLCEGLGNVGNVSALGRDKMFNFPRLLEFNVDYCSDLDELPAGLCSSISLKTLSVTHCHCLAKLPAELGKLGSLQELRLCYSPGLKALPSSIRSLEKLKLLDISSCIYLKVLKVARGKRCELNETLETLAKLPSLKRVICDEKNEQLFSFRTELKVKAVVEQEPSLDWLDREWTKLEF